MDDNISQLLNGPKQDNNAKPQSLSSSSEEIKSGDTRLEEDANKGASANIDETK
jgi:hypothetical protein